ncbi:MAG: hypothetical protein KAS32_16050, partial [Candidatus Peribacteraceae bacterium]|nr:hypothetical protein [Candidatus Peribacteraceae bacterium]
NVDQLKEAGIGESVSWFYIDTIESSGITSIRLRPFPIPSPSESLKIKERCIKLFKKLKIPID